jgi:hypothetical protein
MPKRARVPGSGTDDAEGSNARLSIRKPSSSSLVGPIIVVVAVEASIVKRVVTVVFKRDTPFHGGAWRVVAGAAATNSSTNKSA